MNNETPDRQLLRDLLMAHVKHLRDKQQEFLDGKSGNYPVEIIQSNPIFSTLKWLLESNEASDSQESQIEKAVNSPLGQIFASYIEASDSEK